MNLPTLLYRRLRGDMNMAYKLLSGIYDCDFACRLIKPTHSPKVTIFDYLKSTFIMICANIILEIILYLIRRVCLITSLVLTLLVYLKIDWIVLGLIRHVTRILRPT